MAYALIGRNQPLFKGYVDSGLNIRLKGYVYHQHLYICIGKWFYYNFATGSFQRRNFVADFIGLNFIFIKTTNSLFEPPFGELGVTYALHL